MEEIKTLQEALVKIKRMQELANKLRIEIENNCVDEKVKKDLLKIIDTCSMWHEIEENNKNSIYY